MKNCSVSITHCWTDQMDIFGLWILGFSRKFPVAVHFKSLDLFGICVADVAVGHSMLVLPFKILISKILSYVLILGSCIVKFPQLMKIWKAKSGVGLSVLALTFDLVAVTSKFAYSARHGFPFSTYGEGLFLAFQTASIAFMVLYFAGKTLQAFTFVVLTVLGISLLLSPLTPLEILAFFQAGNIFAVVVSKAIQARTNYTNGSTGQLSAITVFLLFFGTFVRVFTSIAETGDVMLIASYSVSCSFNLIIFIQVIYYRNSSVPRTAKLNGHQWNGTAKHQNGELNGSFQTSHQYYDGGDVKQNGGVLKQNGVLRRAGIKNGFVTDMLS